MLSESPDDTFPRKLLSSGFPHPPPEGSGKVPVTMENVSYLLSQSGVEAGYDVIKKQVRFRRKQKLLETCDLQSLANLNGMGGHTFPTSS